MHYSYLIHFIFIVIVFYIDWKLWKIAEQEDRKAKGDITIKGLFLFLAMFLFIPLLVGFPLYGLLY